MTREEGGYVHFCLYFNDVIFAVIKDFIPVVHINCRKYPHWYDKGIIALITEKFKCRQQFVESGRDKTSEAHKRFCELRKEVKRAQKSRYEQYIDDIGSEMKTNAKRFWTYVKSLKGTSSIPQIMTYCGNKLKTLSEITNGFNNFFKSVFKCDSDKLPNYLSHWG